MPGSNTRKREKRRGMAQQKARVLIRNQQNRIAINLRQIKQMASRILNNLALLNPEVSILLLDDPQITGLNRNYLQRNYPTDVLAFSMNGGPFTNTHPRVLGDVVISVETAQRQALKRKHPLCDEIAYLLIHGILHLLDYDHERSEKEDRRMRRMEKKIFQKITEHSTVSATSKKKTAR